MKKTILLKYRMMLSEILQQNLWKLIMILGYN